jgi:membrane protease YdiL (CAAX protease family)
MTPSPPFFRRHPLATFVALTFALSWYPWLLATLRHAGNPNPNPYGPLLGALLASVLVGGRSGVAAFARRAAHWRIGARWYLLAILAPVGIVLCAAGIARLLGAVPQPSRASVDAGEVVARFVFILLFIGLGEEPGWRGFALPVLQEGRSALRASLLLAVIWGTWHLPLFGTELAWPIVPAFLLGLAATTILQTWLYNRTRGSVIPQMLYHATVNTVGGGLVFRPFTGASLERLWWVYSAIWVALAAVVVLASGARELGRDRALPQAVPRVIPEGSPA